MEYYTCDLQKKKKTKKKKTAKIMRNIKNYSYEL